MIGVCDKSDCPYAHCTRELQSTEAFFRSKLCAFFRRGRCESGEYCRFSHDVNMPRPAPEKRKSQKYNTDEEAKRKAKNDAQVGNRDCRKCNSNLRKFSSTNSAFTDVTESTTYENHNKRNSRSSVNEWDSVSPSDSASMSNIRTRTAPTWAQNGAPAYGRIPVPQMVSAGYIGYQSTQQLQPQYAYQAQYGYQPQAFSTASASTPTMMAMPMPLAEGTMLAQLPFGGGLTYVQMPITPFAPVQHMPMQPFVRGQCQPVIEMMPVYRLDTPMYYED